MSPLQLLQLELKKFVPSATFRLLLSLYLGFFVMVVYLVHSLGSHMTFSANGTNVNPVQDLFCFPRSWEMVAYIGRWLNGLLLGLMGVLLVTIELGNRTLRQNVITGLTRHEVVVAKITVALSIAILATLAWLIIGAVAGVLGSPSISLTQALPPVFLVFRFWLNALDYVLLGMTVGFILRHTALAVILYIPYVLFVELVIHGIAGLLWHSSILDFLPDNVLRNLVAFPVPAIAQQALESQSLFSGPALEVTAIAAVAYLTLFVLLLWNRVCQSDL